MMRHTAKVRTPQRERRAQEPRATVGMVSYAASRASAVRPSLVAQSVADHHKQTILPSFCTVTHARRRQPLTDHRATGGETTWAGAGEHRAVRRGLTTPYSGRSPDRSSTAHRTVSRPCGRLPSHTGPHPSERPSETPCCRPRAPAAGRAPTSQSPGRGLRHKPSTGITTVGTPRHWHVTSVIVSSVRACLYNDPQHIATGQRAFAFQNSL